MKLDRIHQIAVYARDIDEAIAEFKDYLRVIIIVRGNRSESDTYR